MFKNNLLEILRWGLRLHEVSHFIEFLSALGEAAYVTASIVFLFISIEI